MTKHLSRKAIGLLVRPGTARCGWVRGIPCFSSCVHAPPCYLLSQLQGWFWGAGGGLLGLEPQSCSHGEHLSDWGSGNRKISQPGPAVTSCGCWGCLGVSSQRSVVMNAKVGKGVWILLAGWWKHTAIPGVSLLPCWSCDVEVSKWLWSDSDSSLPLVNPELASEPIRGAGRSGSRTCVQVPFPWHLPVSAKSCLPALAQNWELQSTMPASWLWCARRAGRSQPLVIT